MSFLDRTGGLLLERELEKAIKQAKANLELSGFVITEKHEKLVRAHLNGEISEEDFIKTVLEYAKQKSDEEGN